MSTGYLYEPLPDIESGRRLHLNEHTGGCSPAVLRAIRRLTREDISVYPAYARATDRCAAALGVAADAVLLTNGLDEGILTAALAWLPRDGAPAQAVVVEPAYGMFGPSARLAGARVVPTTPPPGLGFELDAVRAAITPATRLVLLASPNNPTGAVVPAEDIRALAAAMPAGGAVFVDEAYADFEGHSVVADVARTPNLVVGRTFAKAYGLAGMRIGCLVAQPAVIRQLRGAIAPFSVNVFAAAALEAALADRGHVEWYIGQVRASRELLYDACTRLGLPFWRSAANFVLVRVGDAAGVRAALAERGIHVRDRSAAPGCAGCIRITAGIVDDTKACVTALEEVVCAGRR
jgi:histidinol-phosphate aminotransferase